MCGSSSAPSGSMGQRWSGHWCVSGVCSRVLVFLCCSHWPQHRFFSAEFIPRLDEGAFALQVLRLPSVSLEESVRQTTQLEQVLLQQFPDEVKDIVSKTGRPEIATDPMGVNISDVFVMLHPESRWKAATSKAELETKMSAALSEIPGLVFSFSQPIELRVNELIAGVRSDLAIKIYGDDLQQLSQVADRVVSAVSALPGAAGFKAQQLEGLPQLQISVLPEQLARYGINAADVMESVEAIGGVPVSGVLSRDSVVSTSGPVSGDGSCEPIFHQRIAGQRTRWRTGAGGHTGYRGGGEWSSGSQSRKRITPGDCRRQRAWP